MATATEKKQFFDNYSGWAVTSMARSGVPASIILAQSVKESGWGTNDLSRNYNNFFGIQCHRWKGWIGKCTSKTDYDSQGKPYPAEFRVYNSPYDSFIDHADFLMDNPRYDSLFENTDYVSWANGLQKSGYAEDTGYAKSLIDIIQQNGLEKYDREGDIQMQTLPNTLIRNRRKLIVITIIIIILLVALWIVGKKIFK